MTPADKQQITAWLANSASWNGGHGLIVPPSVAEELRRLGFKDGFSEQKPLPRHTLT